MPWIQLFLHTTAETAPHACINYSIHGRVDFERIIEPLSTLT